MANTVAYSIILRDKVTVAAQRMSQSIQGVRNQMRGSGGDAARGSKSFDDYAASAVKAGRKLKMFSAAAAVGTGGAIKAFADVEAGASSVLTLLGSAPEMDKWRSRVTQTIKDSVAMGESIEGASQGLFDSVSALGMGEKALDTFRQAQILAIGGNTTIEDSMRGLSNVLRVFEKDNLTAAQASEIFFVAQQKGRTTVAAMAGNIGKVSAVAASLNVGLGETAAVLSEMTISADSTEVASTNLAAIMSALIKPTDEARKMFDRLKIPIGAEEVSKKGLAFTIGKVNEAYAKNADVLSILIPNIRAMRGVTGLSEQSLKNIEATMASYGKTVGGVTALGAAYNENMNTTSQALKEMWGQIKLVAAAIGARLTPLVRALTSTIKFFAFGFMQAGAAIQTLVAFLLVASAAAAPFLIFFGKMAVVLKFIGGAFVTVFAGLTLPIALAIAGVIAVGALLFVYWDKVVDKYNAVRGFISKFGIGGGGEDIDIRGQANVSSKTSIDSTVTIKDPGSMVQDISSITSGKVAGLNIGIALEQGA